MSDVIDEPVAAKPLIRGRRLPPAETMSTAEANEVEAHAANDKSVEVAPAETKPVASPSRMGRAMPGGPVEVMTEAEADIAAPPVKVEEKLHIDPAAFARGPTPEEVLKDPRTQPHLKYPSANPELPPGEFPSLSADASGGEGEKPDDTNQDAAAVTGEQNDGTPAAAAAPELPLPEAVKSAESVDELLGDIPDPDDQVLVNLRNALFAAYGADSQLRDHRIGNDHEQMRALADTKAARERFSTKKDEAAQPAQPAQPPHAPMRGGGQGGSALGALVGGLIKAPGAAIAAPFKAGKKIADYFGADEVARRKFMGAMEQYNNGISQKRLADRAMRGLGKALQDTHLSRKAYNGYVDSLNAALEGTPAGQSYLQSLASNAGKFGGEDALRSRIHNIQDTSDPTVNRLRRQAEVLSSDPAISGLMHNVANAAAQTRNHAKTAREMVADAADKGIDLEALGPAAEALNHGKLHASKLTKPGVGPTDEENRRTMEKRMQEMIESLREAIMRFINRLMPGMGRK